MLPETSVLPLLQPPSIEFINNQFEAVDASPKSQNDMCDEKDSGTDSIKEEIHMDNLENYPIQFDRDLALEKSSSSAVLFQRQQQLALQFPHLFQQHPTDFIIQVECGHNVGYMNLSRLCQGSKGSCIYYNGLSLTPNEFQFVSGRETAKDWKRSIRHNGKSLKLLIKRKLINVHSSSCECFLTNKVFYEWKVERLPSAKEEIAKSCVFEAGGGNRFCS